MLTRGHVWGDDFAAYVMQAKSILASDMDTFVERNAYTVTQSSSEEGHQMGPAAYPWGFPLILAPAYMLFGLSPLGLKLPVLTAYLAFLLTFFFLTYRRLTPTVSLIAVSLFAFNPELLRFLDNIISDIPFLFLSTLAILVADIYDHEATPKRRFTFAALTGAIIFVAFFVRTQGLILLGSILLFQGIRFLGRREQRRQIVTDSILIAAVFSLLWGLTSLIFPGGQTSYLALYADFNITVLKGNIVGYSSLFGEFFAMLPGQALIFGVFAVLFFVGLIARFKSDLLFVLYAVLYLFVIWTWPDWQGYRFIFPLLPFFIYFSFQGISVLLKLVTTNKKVISNVVTGILLLIVAGMAVSAGKNAYNTLHNGRDINGPFDPFSMETYEFIKNEIPSDSIIVFFKPRAMRLMTDRDSLALTECERMSESDYLVLNKKVGENLQISPERIGECGLPLDTIFENRRFIVYQMKK